jgi:succinate dehydrogenase/fumarate reductase-like Fe-S protein
MENDKYINIKIKRMTSSDNNYIYDDFKIKIHSPTNILNLLRKIFKEYDSSVTFFDGCGFGKCKGCFLKVNGKVELACLKIVYPDTEELILEPVNEQKVIADLLTK